MTSYKLQINNKSQETNSKRYDLEERTYQFAKAVLEFVKTCAAKNISNHEIFKQLVRASTSVGANYIEANESLGRKDFAMHICICRKEAKESGFWLRLIEVSSPEFEQTRPSLVDEAGQLVKIFHSILEKCTA